MCEYCHQSTCPPGCPNYEEKPVYTCKHCGESICVGESFAEIDCDYYHEDCLLEFGVSEWLALIDVQLQEAQEPEPDYDVDYGDWGWDG